MSVEPTRDPKTSGDDLLERRPDGVGDRVTSGAAMLYGVGLLLRILQFATTVILARLLLPTDYGVVALAATVTGLLDVISDLQVGGSIVRTDKVDKSHLDTAFTISLGRSLLIATILAATAHPLSLALHEPRLENVLYVLAVSAVISGFNNPYFHLFERNISFSQEAWRAGLAAIIGAAVSIGAAMVFRNYWALVAGGMVRSSLHMILSFYRVPGRPGFSLARFREMFAFGGWLTLVGVIDYANGRVDYLLVGRNFGSTTLGNYHVGAQVAGMATGDVVGPLSRAIFPAFALFINDEARLRSSYQRAQTVIIGLALPIGLGTALLAGDIVRVLMGDKWDAAIPVVRILAPIIALQTLVAGANSVAYALGRTGLLFQRSIIFFIVRTALLFLGFWAGGFMGILYARLCSGTFYLIYHMALAAQLTGSRVTDPIVGAWRSLVSAAAMGAVLATLDQTGVTSEVRDALGTAPYLALQIVLGGMVYVGSHMALWFICGRPGGFEATVCVQGAKVAERMASRRMAGTLRAMSGVNSRGEA